MAWSDALSARTGTGCVGEGVWGAKTQVRLQAHLQRKEVVLERERGG